MRIPRIYHPPPLTAGDTITLRKAAGRHLTTVLRMRPGAPLTLFDGRGNRHSGVLKDSGRALVGDRLPVDAESPLPLHLLQAVSKGERMDFVIQKATELGVRHITPVLSRRSVVRLKGERAARRVQHWREIVINACEQCGRDRLPVVHGITPLESAVTAAGNGLKLLLDPESEQGLKTLQPPEEGRITLLIGPEGGLAAEERSMAGLHGFLGIRLGPRILRTETAAITALSALQTLWGDLA